MIFVTVGTHEQPFNRLVKYIDELKASNEITEKVIIQIGFSTYEPKYCIWNKLFPYQEMIKKIEEARIIITHGGPSSFLMPLQIGKIPIVVPRQKQFDEHINDHQVDFCRAVAERYGDILVVEDIAGLRGTILDYEARIKNMPAGMKSNNKKFNEKFENIVDKLMKQDKINR